jgi:hypothetical protein
LKNEHDGFAGEEFRAALNDRGSEMHMIGREDAESVIKVR